ncbi:peptide-binding protein [Streptomyces sp. AV19]|uniref:ABC transporter substrate-binding protein n=1 Tax=Streptomyces sp. AV19 TaxID=2793068 RepID=UPI0018FF07EA|nr:ABC transporter substrate-binding protein [Streptomyces sp. AV19]MBH1935928.1 peptide-binding protein [Streptomyces sp. AV19]MDG4534289.1 ABC transporter substrate-binding protein [Streptomyces sp. AV19]
MRGIRRRRGRARGGAFSTFLVVSVLGLGGCSLVASDDGDDEAITVGTTDTVTTLDPAGAYDAGSWALFGNLYQSLLTFAPGADAPVPDAARDCRFTSEELRVYTCRLREGLKFANGHDLTARDVKFSFDRILRIRSDQGPGPLLSTLKSVETGGTGTVTFKLRSPDATFPFKIATGAGAIVDSTLYPADRLRPRDAADGSGPYRLKSYAAGATAELTPNGRYRGAVKKPGHPVTVNYFADPAKMAVAWKKRSVDVVSRQLPPADTAKLSLGPGEEKDFQVTENSSANTRFLVFNLRDGSPVKQTAVRRAVAAALDREVLTRDVHRRTVEPLYSLIPQGVSGHTTSFYDRYPRPDADAARRLLTSAGVAPPVRFRVAYSKGAATREEAAMMKRQLEATGLFRVDTTYVEWKKFQEGYARGAYDAFCLSWIADFPDADTFTSPLLGPASALHSGYADDRVTKLIRRAQLSSRRDRATETYRAIQKIVAEDVPLVPLWQKKEYVVSKDSISGAQYLSDGTGLWRLWRLGRI